MCYVFNNALTTTLVYSHIKPIIDANLGSIPDLLNTWFM